VADFLTQEFECRLTAVGTKGNRMTPGRKGFTALFLLANDLGVSAPDILQEAIETVKKRSRIPTKLIICHSMEINMILSR